MIKHLSLSELVQIWENINNVNPTLLMFFRTPRTITTNVREFKERFNLQISNAEIKSLIKHAERQFAEYIEPPTIEGLDLPNFNGLDSRINWKAAKEKVSLIGARTSLIARLSHEVIDEKTKRARAAIICRVASRYQTYYRSETADELGITSCRLTDLVNGEISFSLTEAESFAAYNSRLSATEIAIFTWPVHREVLLKRLTAKGSKVITVGALNSVIELLASEVSSGIYQI
ncbi:MAG: hypothetical protein R3A13_01105 [Bdellovibrionota bacterium]